MISGAASKPHVSIDEGMAKKGTEMQKVPSIEEAVAQVKQTVEADAVASGWASVEGPSLDAPPEEGDTGFMATLF